MGTEAYEQGVDRTDYFCGVLVHVMKMTSTCTS
jgi:hypothetical protein